jgi:hypothetical protein
MLIYKFFTSENRLFVNYFDKFIKIHKYLFIWISCFTRAKQPLRPFKFTHQHKHHTINHAIRL